jgi:hypothetical protein
MTKIFETKNPKEKEKRKRKKKKKKKQHQQGRVAFEKKQGK